MNITSIARRPVKSSRQTVFPLVTSGSAKRGAGVPSGSMVDGVKTMASSSLGPIRPIGSHEARAGQEAPRPTSLPGVSAARRGPRSARPFHSARSSSSRGKITMAWRIVLPPHSSTAAVGKTSGSAAPSVVTESTRKVRRLFARVSGIGAAETQAVGPSPVGAEDVHRQPVAADGVPVPMTGAACAPAPGRPLARTRPRQLAGRCACPCGEKTRVPNGVPRL